MAKRVFSFGGGVQSVAVLALQATGQIEPFDVYVFANVGDKSENPETITYLQNVAMPYAKDHGIELVEIKRRIRGEVVDLYDYTLNPEGRTIPIPIVFPNAGFGNRTCTLDWKVMPVSRYIKERYAGEDVELGIGFSSDERRRQYKKPDFWHDCQQTGDRLKGFTAHENKPLGYRQRYVFPLENINRGNCEEVIRQAGLPIPPKSACWFCPFTSRSVWVERKKQPDYDMYIEFQDAVNEKYQRIRESSPHRVSRVAIHRDGIDLRNVADQLSLVGLWDDMDEECQVGYCGV